MANDNTKQYFRALKRLANNILARGEIKSIRNGKTATAQIGLMEGEVYDGIEYPQDYGFVSVPPSGSEAIVAFFGGNRDHGTILKTFNKAQAPITLAPGEAALYNSSGSMIHAKSNGDISIQTASGASLNIGNDGSMAMTSPSPLTITCPGVHMTGDLTVDGTIHN
jgi:phage baseplate assembly protein V